MMNSTIFDLSRCLISISAQCKELNIILRDAKIHVWPQVWGDTSCGFGGYAGQTMTEALTIILEDNGAYHIFIDGRHAYSIMYPTDYFYELFSKQRLPGKVAFNRSKYEKITPTPEPENGK